MCDSRGCTQSRSARAHAARRRPKVRRFLHRIEARKERGARHRDSEHDMDAAPPPSARARRLGPYLLGRLLGSGGMASVFVGRGVAGLRPARVVAVKVMATALAGDPAAKKMFEREALIAAR